MRTREELLNLSLPKWPQCIITGTKIPEEQALEIIRRTDRFFRSPDYCNDKYTAKKIMKILSIPECPSGTMSEDAARAVVRKYFSDVREWQSRWRYIYLNYLDNDWILCDTVQGVQGWCNPDGVIDYHYNIGKWPECREVLYDLTIIATEWPFLELECTLMNGEYCEEDISPVISFLVRNGEVEVIDPKERNIHQEFDRDFDRENWMHIDESVVSKLVLFGSDSAVSIEVIESWAKFLKE